MYAFIKGLLVQSSPISVIIEANGIGYRLYIPASVFGKLPQINNQVILHTSYVVRELSQTLYGFQSEIERDLFEELMGVTGIGPKMALNVIGHLSLQDLQRAVSSHDIVTLSKVPGIGKKTAERLIIEMRDKLSHLLPVGEQADRAAPMPTDLRAQKIVDAMGALINLGYNQMTAQKAIKKSLNDLPEEIDLATLITHSLKHV
jgi:Holliday junction DNA helicase RuvA